MIYNAFLFGGDHGIYQSVGKIRGAVQYSLIEKKQRIRRRAESILRNIPESNPKMEIDALYDWAKNRSHYVKDPRGVEYVKSPELSDDEISRYGSFLGDCDDSAAYVAALLKSVGYRVRLVIISDKRLKRPVYNHIFTTVFNPKTKQWSPVDCTVKNKPTGWKPPTQRISYYEI